MKKKYQKPIAEFVELQSFPIFNGGSKVNGVDNNADINYGGSDAGEGTPSAHSREYSFWDMDLE